MKPVLDWIKSNVLVVVFAVVAIGALVAGWFLSSSMNASVRLQAEARARKMTELTALEKSSVTLNIPGKEPVTKSLVLNQPLLDQYKEITDKLRGDADQVHALALAHNRRDHKPVLDGVFPQPPAAKRQTIAFAMHKELVAAYDALIKSVNGGMPPVNEQMGDDLMRRESQFVQSTLKKASREALDATELQALKSELTKSRLGIYGEQAQKISLYVSPSNLDIPMSPERAVPSLGTLFDWQWKYWVTSDVLGAIADASATANGGTPGSVLKSPVKRVISIRIPDGGFTAKQQPQGASFGGSNSGAGFGGSGDGSTPSAAAAPAPGVEPVLAPPQIDQTAEAARDYKRSFTGRETNPIFDVRRAEVVLVIETARLPEFFDALARRNFMTVLDVKVQPADAFAAARDGFIYGKAPVSTVSMTVESVWLREWTAPLMPADVRTALGITVPAAADPAAGAAPPAG